MARCLRSP
ncbi:hypothetical protein HU200_006143 [Digitaria exilis]|uniref:Uncharacterized protein n=1 Tax=Digitaria exilis TaxID=1010633 RepID=A0A835KS49_9POAL|nr:hypothetical protein HU200_006143 [Digitaria exilis]